ncbi:hypothetical protein C8J56DRAFT_893797 [Mycena floridula]|nr:hypothetical protein C8J56DRAFT_893797 [Mycena floridula]
MSGFKEGHTIAFDFNYPAQCADNTFVQVYNTKRHVISQFSLESAFGNARRTRLHCYTVMVTVTLWVDQPNITPRPEKSQHSDQQWSLKNARLPMKTSTKKGRPELDRLQGLALINLKAD